MKNRFMKTLSLMVVLCVCVGLFGLCAGTLPKLTVLAEGTNLIVNGGAEDGETGWSGDVDLGEDVFKGSKSFKLPTSESKAYIKQTVSVEANTNYVLTWVEKGEASSFILKFDGAWKTNICKSETLSWTAKSFAFTTTENQSKLSVEFVNDAAAAASTLTASVYIDNIILQKVTNEGIVLNGGAELGEEGWNGSESIYVKGTLISTAAYTGDYSFKVPVNQHYCFTQTISVTPNTAYNISWYEKGTATEVGFHINGDWKANVVKSDTTNWTRNSVTYTTGASETEIGIMFKKNGTDTGVAYVDDIKVETVIASAPTVYVGDKIDDAAYGDGTRQWQGIPSTAMDKESGRLWATWYSGGAGEEVGNYVIVYTSNDGGETWGKPNMVIAPPENARCFDSNLWVDPDGNMWLFWAESKGAWFDGYGGVWAMKTANPGAEFPTWSEPVRIANGIAMNDPVVLSNGDWMLPTNIFSTPVVSGITDERNCSAYISNDKGATWNYQGSVKGYTDTQTGKMDDHLENMIIEANGKLYMYIRTGKGIEVSESSDNGKTWTNSIEAGISKVASRFYIGKVGGKVLLVANNLDNTATNRSNMTAAFVTIAEDGTLTKDNSIIIDERDSTSYPDVAFASDGTINIIYDRIRFQGHGEILMAKITEADILSGSISGASKLKMLINDNRYPNTDGSILDNGSFENDERSWNYNGGNNFLEVTSGDGFNGISTTVAHSGTKSLVVRDTKHSHFSQHFSVEKNTDYILNFWVKGAEASSCNLNFKLGDLGTENGSIISNAAIPYRWYAGWQLVTYEFNSGNNLDLSFTIQNTADTGAATRYLDDFVIVKKASIQDGLLKGSSFEGGFNDWDGSDDQGFVFGLDDDARSGNFALPITNSWCKINQTVDVKKNTDYILSYWIKGGKHGLGVYIGGANATESGNWDEFIAQYWPGNAEDWTRYNGRVNSGENEALKVVIRATGNAANDIYDIRKIDDVILREVGDVNADEEFDIRDLVHQKLYNEKVEGVTVDHDFTNNSVTDNADLNGIRAKLLGLN